MLAAKYGSDEKGWEYRLAVQVNVSDGTFQCFFLDEADMADTAAVTVSKILTLLAIPDENAQLSSAAGTFTD
jgi:hypothetical protein